MRRNILLLVMLLTAATAYNQSSRRTSNSRTTARKQIRHATSEPSNQKHSASDSNNNQNRRSVTTDRNSKVRNNQTGISGDSRVPVYKNSAAATRHTRHGNTSVNNSQNINKASSPGSGHYTRVNRTHGKASSKAIHSSAHRQPHGSLSGTIKRREYASPRIYRKRREVIHHYQKPSGNREYRASHHACRKPLYVNIHWTPKVRHHFTEIYPFCDFRHHSPEYRIPAVSSYYTPHYMGNVMHVYGQVHEVFYSLDSDEYFLYFGACYPYHDFTMVLPGWIGRKYSRYPERYFLEKDVVVSGLITSFHGEPEIVVKRSFQINLY